MSNGARALARFTVRSDRPLEMPGLLSFRTLKRSECRVPHSAQYCYLFARHSLNQTRKRMGCYMHKPCALHEPGVSSRTTFCCICNKKLS